MTFANPNQTVSPTISCTDAQWCRLARVQWVRRNPYRGRKVADQASIAVRAGEAVGLLGPNAAGKTTIFYMMMGLIPVDRGRVDLDGHDISRFPMYRRARLGVGYSSGSVRFSAV